MNGWASGWVGEWFTFRQARFRAVHGDDLVPRGVNDSDGIVRGPVRALLIEGREVLLGESHGVAVLLGRWVGGWVGYGEVEEIKTVRWVGGVGGWVGGWVGYTYVLELHTHALVAAVEDIGPLVLVHGGLTLQHVLRVGDRLFGWERWVDG